MYIGNDLFLDNLEEAQNLTLPKIVRRHTYLKKLKKYKDLTLPEESDYIYLGQLEVAKNPLYVKNIKIFDAFNLMDISGLKLSREMTEDRFFVPGVTLDELTYNGEAYYTNEKQLIKHR